MQVNIHEAKAHLSRLVERAAKGEEIIIAKAGTPVARLVSSAESKPRQPGFWKGRMVIAPDFDELPAGTRRAFAGKAE